MGGRSSRPRAPRQPPVVLEEPLSVMTVKLRHCYLIRMSCDMMLFYHNVQAINTSLLRPENSTNTFHHKIILRANRNTAYLKKEKYFHCAGILGQGSFGMVELVSLKSEVRFYALKTMAISEWRQLKSGIIEAFVERDTWLTLSGEHVVKLKAAWIESGRPDKADTFCMLCELMCRGSMADLLKQLHPMTTSMSDFSWSVGAFEHIMAQPTLVIAPSSLVNLMAAEASLVKINENYLCRFRNIYLHYIESLIRAVAYLHQHKIVHHDLKADNILVGADLRLKLADLGLSSPFKKEHSTQMFSWTHRDATVHREIDYSNRQELDCYPHIESAFASYREQEGYGTNIPGNKLHQPPECNIFYYEMPRHSNERFPVHKHYPADWYAVGLIIYHLITGAHPLANIKVFNDFSNIPGHEIVFKAKYQPQQYNRFIYGEEPYDHILRSFLIDERFLSIIRPLLEPDYRRRPTGPDVLNQQPVREFFEQCRTEETLNWAWNEFREHPLKTIGMRLVEDFRNGVRTIFQSASREGTRKLPDLPSFPIMTESPNIVPSP